MDFREPLEDPRRVNSRGIRMAAKLPKRRVDEVLVERGMACDRETAEGLIRAGQVYGADRRYEKPGERVSVDIELSIKGRGHPYVGRGGVKLAGALDGFRIDPQDRICLDLGASTGGFTDCLLQRGARQVIAVDVGRGQLHERLRRDPRVVAREHTDLRSLARKDLPEDLSLLVADLSFISLASCLPAIGELCPPECDAVLLVKPQFELPAGAIPRGGVVTDDTARQQAVEIVLEAARVAGFRLLGTQDSPIPGAEGNREVFVHLRWQGNGARIPITS